MEPFVDHHRHGRPPSPRPCPSEAAYHPHEAIVDALELEERIGASTACAYEPQARSLKSLRNRLGWPWRKQAHDGDGDVVVGLLVER